MKQMPLPVAQRRWWFNALFASGQIVAEIVFGLLGSAAGWGLCASVPLAVVSWTAWWLNRAARQREARPDYARIALLEHELLGIEPEPGTFAAAAVAMAAFTPRSIRRDRGPVYFSGGYVSSDRTINDLPPFPAAVTRPKPVPPPGRGAGSPTTR